jgi:hypothetical protein
MFQQVGKAAGIEIEYIGNAEGLDDIRSDDLARRPVQYGTRTSKISNTNIN